MLTLIVSSLALAADASNQTTSYGSQVEATRLDMIDQQLADIKAQQAEVQANLVKTVRTMNWRIGQLKAANATPAVVAADPQLAMLTAENTALTEQNEALKSLIAEFDTRIKALETAEPQVVHDTVTKVETNTVEKIVEIRNGTHFTVNAGETLLVAKPLPEQKSGMQSRTDLGVRFSWGLSDEVHQAAIDAGVGFGNGGISIRGVPTFLLTKGSSNLGFGLGVEYSCDGLWSGDGACSAEHTGGLGQVTYSKSFGAWGLTAKAGVLENYVLTPTSHGMQTEAFIGIGAYLGRAQHVATFE